MKLTEDNLFYCYIFSSKKKEKILSSYDTREYSKSINQDLTLTSTL